MSATHDDNPNTDTAINEAQSSAAVDKQAIKQKIIEALRTIYDPEIPVNIYDMSLIYGILVNDDRTVKITMTLTTPMCPVAESLPLEVRSTVAVLAEVEGVEVELTWEPPWTPQMMSEEAKLQLGFM